VVDVDPENQGKINLLIHINESKKLT